MTVPWVNHPQTLPALQRLVRQDLWPWGRLCNFTEPQAVAERLNASPAAFIKDQSSSLIHVYHTRELGVARAWRVSLSTLALAVQSQQIDAYAPVTLRYQHGNVFCLISPEHVPLSVQLSQDLYLYVDSQQQCLIGHHVGKHHWHHALYTYTHLDGKVTSLSKLIQTQRFSSVYISTGSEDALLDIPY